jgi:hypothetical protein
MDGFAGVRDCIADDRGLLPLSICDKAVAPRWIYAGYCWRHGVVLRAWISTIANGADKASPVRVVIDQFVSSFARFETIFCTVKKTYNK